MRQITIVAVSLVACLLSNGMIQAQEDAGNVQQMMESWMKTIEPGTQHKRLAPLVGEWETTTRTFWGGQSGAAHETKGTATKKWVLGDRFVMQEFKGEFPLPNASGEVELVPYEGLGMLGYDNYRRVYVHSWADSLSTALLRTTGTMPPSGTTIQLYGEMDEPMLRMTGRTIRFETEIVDDDTHVFTIYDLAVSPDYKVIQITYKRKS